MICGNGSLRDRQRRRIRIDIDPRAHHDVAEVERARDRRHHDRQPERGTPVRAGQVQRAFLIERVPTRTRSDRHRPDLRRFRARPQARLRLPAQRNTRQRPQQPRRGPDLDRREILFAVFTAERHRQRAELPRVRIRRPRAERRAERQHRRTRPTMPVPVHTERRDRVRVRRDRGAPRRQIRGRRERPAALRRRQRRAQPTLEVQFQVAERHLRVIRERSS